MENQSNKLRTLQLILNWVHGKMALLEDLCQLNKIENMPPESLHQFTVTITMKIMYFNS